MNLKKIKIIKDVKLFTTATTEKVFFQEYFKKGNNIFKLSLKNLNFEKENNTISFSSIIKTSRDKLFGIGLFDNKLYTLNGKIINDFKGLSFLHQMNENTNYIFAFKYNASFKIAYYFLYNLDNKKELFKLKGFDIQNHLITKFAVFFDNSRSELLSYTITGKKLWQLNLSKEFNNQEISRFIGVAKDVLLVGIGTSTDVDNYIVGIATQTGKILWKTKTSISSHIVINKEKNILQSIIGKYYFEINIETGILNKIQYAEDDNEFNSQRTNFVIVDNHLITTDWRKGKIGAFNTITHKFDWIYEEEGISFPGGSPMLYKAPYLFVQDNKSTVHVFKKEENIKKII